MVWHKKISGKTEGQKKKSTICLLEWQFCKMSTNERGEPRLAKTHSGFAEHQREPGLADLSFQERVTWGD